MTITLQQKYDCALRELNLRKRVYPNRIETGRMSHAKAAHEYRVMAAIVKDYAEWLADRQPDLISLGEAAEAVVEKLAAERAPQ